MLKTKIIIPAVVVITLVGLFVWQMPEGSFGGFYFKNESGVEAQKIDLEKEASSLSKFGFRVSLPEGATLTDFEDANGNSVLIKKDSFEMQIFISDFDEDISLTAERIKKDIPDIQMYDTEEVQISGTKGVAFLSPTEQGTKNREVWFIRNYKLYQVMSKPEFDSVVGKIMQSWKWE